MHPYSPVTRYPDTGAHSTDLAFSGAVGDSLRADLLRLCQRKTSAMVSESYVPIHTYCTSHAHI